MSLIYNNRYLESNIINCNFLDILNNEQIYKLFISSLKLKNKNFSNLIVKKINLNIFDIKQTIKILEISLVENYYIFNYIINKKFNVFNRNDMIP